MKKSEVRKIVHRLAPEYARSGKYSNWLSVEHALRSDGFELARTELDRDYLRKELDKICLTAQSDAETIRREAFRGWLESIVNSKDDILAKSNVITHLSLMEMQLYPALFVSGGKEQIVIRRIFGSNLLEYTAGSVGYNAIFNSVPNKVEYSQLTFENLISIIESLVRYASTMRGDF